MSTTPAAPTEKIKKGKLSPQDLMSGEVYSVPERKYLVSESMLDTLSSGFASILSVVLGLFMGAAGVLWGLWSQASAEPSKTHYLEWASGCTALVFVCFLLCVREWWERYRAKKNLKKNAKFLC